MEQHFNEKYVESDEFPTATFHGKINDFKYSYLDDVKKIPTSYMKNNGMVKRKL